MLARNALLAVKLGRDPPNSQYPEQSTRYSGQHPDEENVHSTEGNEAFHDLI
jgi:hypothetical protein